MTKPARPRSRWAVPGVGPLFALLAACTVPNPGYDPGIDAGLGAADGPGTSGATNELALAPADAAPVKQSDARKPDAAKARSDAAPAKDKAPAAPAFGRICTSAAGCAAGELCIFAEAAATKGICLRQCSQPNTPCSVPDPKFFSGCSTYFNSSIGTVHVCSIFCRGAGGASYPCPNATDYKCKLYGPEMGMCIPK